jgi:hypothetical protein
VERYNADLANNLGNLINRVHTLVSRNEVTDFRFDRGHEPYQAKTDEIWKAYVADMENFDLHEAVHHAFRLTDFANKQMEEEKPWSQLKEDREAGEANQRQNPFPVGPAGRDSAGKGGWVGRFGGLEIAWRGENHLSEDRGVSRRPYTLCY